MNYFGHIRFVSRSEVGLKRQNNEDSHGEFPTHGVWCVADGMGGGDDGEVASAAVVQSIAAFCKEHPVPKTGMYSGADVSRSVIRAVNSASTWIFKRAMAKSLKGCGSTFVGVVFDAANPKQAQVLHAGDSRLYRLRGRELRQITKDHSAAELIGAKSEADISPMFRGMILRAVGVHPSVDIEITPLTVKDGDSIVICSDGLSKMITDRQIADIVRKNADDIVGAADGLIQAAYAAGATDNVTVNLLRIGSLPAAAAAIPLPDSKPNEDEAESDEPTTGDTCTGALTWTSGEGAVTNATASTDVFDESEEGPSGGSVETADLRFRLPRLSWWMVIAGAVLLSTLVSALTWYLSSRTSQRVVEMPVSASVRMSDATTRMEVLQVAEPIDIQKAEEFTVMPETDIPEPTPHESESPKVDEPSSQPVDELSAKTPESADEVESKAMLARKLLDAQREKVKSDEEKAIKAGVEYGEALESLIEMSRGQAFVAFSRKISESCGESAGDRLVMIAKRLADMKPDNSKAGAAACDLVIEIQKVGGLLKSRSVANWGKDPLRGVVNLDPASAKAYRACVISVEALAKRMSH